MTNKRILKKDFQIKKVKRVLKLKSEGFQPHTYELFKVSGPRGFVKYFVSRKDAKSYIDKVTDRTITK